MEWKTSSERALFAQTLWTRERAFILKDSVKWLCKHTLINGVAFLIGKQSWNRMAFQSPIVRAFIAYALRVDRTDVHCGNLTSIIALHISHIYKSDLINNAKQIENKLTKASKWRSAVKRIMNCYSKLVISDSGARNFEFCGRVIRSKYIFSFILLLASEQDYKCIFWKTSGVLGAFRHPKAITPNTATILNTYT